MSNSHWDWGQITAPIVAGVHLKGDGLYDLLMNGNDDQVDALISELQSFGMDTLRLTGEELRTLADHHVTLEGDMELEVEGTCFLKADHGALTSLLGGVGQVETSISWAGFGQVLAGGQGGLDSYLSNLQSVGVDIVEFDSGQITKLAQAGLQFGASAPAAGASLQEASGGLRIEAKGTGFLHQDYGASADQIHHLFAGASDVTVDFESSDIAHLLAGGDPALDALLTELKDLGVDHFKIDDNFMDQLVDNGQFTFGEGFDLTVDGTSFLSKDPADLSHIFADAANVTMNLSMDFLGTLGAGVGGAQSFIDRALDAHIDNLTTSQGEVNLAATLGADGVLSASELADMLDQLSGNAAAPAVGYTAADLPQSDAHDQDLAALMAHHADQGTEPVQVDQVAEHTDADQDLSAAETQLLGLADEVDVSVDPFHHKG